MIYRIQVIIALCVVCAIMTEGFRMTRGSRINMALSDYKEELAKTAAAIAAPGMHLLVIFWREVFTFEFNTMHLSQGRVFLLSTSPPRPLANAFNPLVLRTPRRLDRLRRIRPRRFWLLPRALGVRVPSIWSFLLGRLVQIRQLALRRHDGSAPLPDGLSLPEETISHTLWLEPINLVRLSRHPR